jgi:transcriptional regulator with XRE-family HTH domain
MIDRARFYAELGSKLRATREAKGLRQAELAEAVGISRTSLTNIECGRQRVLVDQLAVICGKLGTSPAELIPDQAPHSKGAQDKLANIAVVANFLESVARREQ